MVDLEKVVYEKPMLSSEIDALFNIRKFRIHAEASVTDVDDEEEEEPLPGTNTGGTGGF